MKIADFFWKDERRAGVFLHVSSLPSDFGIGNVGSASDAFFGFCKAAGFSYWQICPMGPTGFGDSPYQSFSAFAGNPYFIDPQTFVDAGLLKSGELDSLRALPKDRCDFGAIYNILPPLIKKAAEKYFSLDSGAKRIAEKSLLVNSDFEKFCWQKKYWLDSYALYTALKNGFAGKPWWLWPSDYKDFRSAKKMRLDAAAEENIKSVKFAQWVFFGQYKNFRLRAKAADVEIFGDLPIFLARDSAEVWSMPKIFDLDKKGNPRNVAGVGPDYFCEEGQLWGNPLYDWKGAKKSVYAFWRERIAAALEMYDMIRFDHFRGFADYWAIPFESNDARKGSWKYGPGVDFFNFLRGEFPEGKFVAEDLGVLTKVSKELLEAINIPSMSVLQFAFGDTAKNPYLPHNVRRNCVYYTGTHDNSTSLGWYAEASEAAKDEFRRYFRASGDCANWDMIHGVIMSAARIAIITMQDILSCGAECRMNTPGKPRGNWQWRMSADALARAVKENAPYLHSINELSDRWRKKDNTEELSENNVEEIER